MLVISLSTITPFTETSDEIDIVQVEGLETIVNEQNGVSFQITPIDFNDSRFVTFEVRIDTHQGDLNFDILNISLLETLEGRKFSASSWEGSPSGGHHRYEILTFPSVGEMKSLSLIIRDVYEIPERTFIWAI